MMSRFVKYLCLPLLALWALGISGCGNPAGKVPPPKDPTLYAEAAGNEQLSFYLQEVRLLRPADLMELRVELQVTNKTDEPLDMKKLGVQVLDAGGQPVPEYFKALAKPYVVPAQGSDVVSFAFRPTMQHLAGALTVVVGGVSKVVKDGNAPAEADPGAVKIFTGPNWSDPRNIRPLATEEKPHAPAAP